MARATGHPNDELFAQMISSQVEGIGALPPCLGLEEKDFSALLTQHFPKIQLVVRSRETADDPRALERDDVLGLLLEHRAHRNMSEQWMAEIVTTACMANDHLWTIEIIHPFADGNGRAGRALALWELYRRGFDTHHIFSVDEYFWEDRPAYYGALDQVRRAGEDLTGWLEYSAQGVRLTLERVWARIQTIAPSETERIILRPKQERLMQLLGAHGSMAPSEIWDALDISRQGAMNLLNPLIDAGLVEKVGTKKTGRYRLR